MRVDCDLCFSKIPCAFDDATVIVRVEDSSRADAAAELICEHRFAGVSRTSGDTDPLPLVIDVPASERLAHCTLRVHVDIGSTGEVKRGDHVSTQSYPLPMGESPRHLAVSVFPVE